MIDISVIVPTYNRLDRLKRVLSALEKQTYPRESFEVIVVSDGSSDGTAEFLKAYSSPILLEGHHQANQGPAAARNTGIKMARGAYVLFLDDDVVPSENLIQEHMASHRRWGEKSVVIGTMLSPDDFKYSPWVDWEQYKLAGYYEGMVSGRYKPSPRLFYTGNGSVARRWLIESGGFNPTFRRAEDIELAYRLEILGLEFYFEPGAAGFHYAERSFDSWLDTPYQYGRNDVIFAAQNQRPDLRNDIFRDYSRRNILLRLFVRLYLDRAGLTRATTALFKSFCIAANRLGLRLISLALCSALFNLRYFQGVCDQIDGKQAFFIEAEQMRKKVAHARAV